MKPIPAAFSRILLQAVFLLAVLLSACRIGQDPQVDNTLTFSRHFDSLSRYDSLVIEVKNPDGSLLAVIFEEKAVNASQLANLNVPGWDGGPIVILISGYVDGKSAPVYQEEKLYNGATRGTESKVLIQARPILSASNLSITLPVGQRTPLPSPAFWPADLDDPALRWSSDQPGIAAVEGGSLAGISDGVALLSAKLVRDSSVSIVFTVEVTGGSRAPNRITLDRDTLRLAQYGAPGKFGIAFEPLTASTAVTWRLADTNLVAMRSDGAFIGLIQGLTRVWVFSQADSQIGDSGFISVAAPMPVTSIRFRLESLVLYLGGAPEKLEVEVLPSQANSEALFTLSDPAKASLENDMLAPKAAGAFTVLVRSKEDSSKSDILAVEVREPVTIQGVVALEPAITLYLGAPPRILTAKVLPDAAPQGVRWKSLSPAVASVDPVSGETAPLQAGVALVVVSSQVDTAARDTVEVSVKADRPLLSIAADSVVSAGATVTFQVKASQEFGTLNLFQWSLDGDIVWDDSLSGPWSGTSVDLPPVTRTYDQPGKVTARFRVRDGEGNVSDGAWVLRVVGGAAVSIDEPANNSSTNQKTIQVAWSVNGVPQDTATTETLKANGANLIIRAARDSAGKVVADTITVHLDTDGPKKPVLAGTSPTNIKPKWTWSSGGGGSGEYRVRLGDSLFSPEAPTTRDTAHTLADNPVTGTTYILFVQERDLAGNWSPVASLPIRFDLSKPVVAITAPQASGTFYTPSASVILSGTAGGLLPVAKVTYRIGAGEPSDAALTPTGWNTPAVPIPEGTSVTVIVTAVDEAGNSGEASVTLFRDGTPPGAPTIITAPDPVISALRGTFAWSAGADVLPGSGLNGRYRYNLNGGAWKDTSETLLSNLPLIVGNNVFSVQEQDRALQWSVSATKTVRVDNAGPVITLSSHANPASISSLTMTLSGTVKDSGSSIAGMTVSGQVAGSGTVPVSGSTWTTAALTLKSGANTLLFTASDAVDNISTLSVTVNVNIPAPVVVITNPADNLTITNQSSIVVTYTIDGGPAQTRTFPDLTEGNNNLVIASPANASGNIGRDTVKVTFDGTLPLAPTLTRSASPTNGTATWTFTSRGDNTGGSGVRTPPRFRYSLNSGTTFTETNATQHQITAEGSYTLVVQEMDRAGNWSPSSTPQTIVVDKTGPSVDITWPPRNNYVTNQASVTLRYKVNKEEPEITSPTACALSVTDGANQCSATATDNVGNATTVNITVYRRSNKIFVTVAGAGTRSGNDWENAMRNSDMITALANTALTNKEFWVATGTYADSRYVYVSTTIRSGFNAATFPHTADNNRNKAATRYGYFQAMTGITINMDGGTVDVFGSSAGAIANLTDLVVDPVTSQSYGLYFPDGGTHTFTNVSVVDQTFTGAAVFMGTGTLTINGGAIRGNKTSQGGIYSVGTVRLQQGAVVSGNTRSSGTAYQIEIYAPGKLYISQGVSVSCTQVLVDEGSSCGPPP